MTYVLRIINFFILEGCCLKLWEVLRDNRLAYDLSFNRHLFKPELLLLALFIALCMNFIALVKDYLKNI